MRNWNLNLPDKPLKFKKAGGLSVGMILLTMPLLLLAGLALLWFTYGTYQDIQRDRLVGKDYVVVENARVTGSCKSSLGILVRCNTIIRHKGKPLKKSFSFFDFNSGNYATEVIAPRANPQALTLSVAVEKTGARTGVTALMAAIALVLVAAFFVGFFVRLPRERSVLAAMNARDAQPWRLAELDVALTRNGIPKNFTTQVDGKPYTFLYPYNKKSEPWVLSTQGNKATVLAFAAKNGTTAIPIDQAFSQITGLSEEEKTHLGEELRRQLSLNQTA